MSPTAAFARPAQSGPLGVSVPEHGTPSFIVAAYEKAYRRAADARLVAYRNTDGTYAVPSVSEPGREHVVRAIGRRWYDLSCDCKGGNHAACQHRAVVVHGRKYGVWARREDTHSVRADLLPAAPPAWVAEQRAGLADQVAYVRRAYGGARPTSEDAAPAPARRPYDAMEERVNRDYADACVAASKRQQQALRNSDTPFVDEMRRLSAERHAAALAAPVGTFIELCGEVPHAALFS